MKAPSPLDNEIRLKSAMSQLQSEMGEDTDDKIELLRIELFQEIQTQIAAHTALFVHVDL